MAKHKVEITGIKTSELKVLSNEEQMDLFNKMKNGDIFAREKLIEGNYKLVLSILRKFNNRYVFEMLPPNALTDYDAFYAVDVKGNVSFFSPVFAKNPGDFLNLKPMVTY